MDSKVAVGVIGDFNPSNETHRATNDALKHAADALGEAVNVQWIPTPDLDDGRVESVLREFHGLWCAPASPYQSMGGALEGIRFARERGWPFIGT